MSEMVFQKQVLNRLERVEKSMNQILERMEDSRLTDEEKRLLDEAMKDHKKGRLLSSKEVFG